MVVVSSVTFGVADMYVLVEDLRTGQTRMIDTAPPLRKPKPLIQPDQGSVLMESVRKTQNPFWMRSYTTDGCNKSEKASLGKALGKTRSELPYPCWKATAKRSRRPHQWKRQRRGYVSARILNLMGRCIYPDYISL